VTIPRYTLADGYEISTIIKGGWHLAGGHGAIDLEQASRLGELHVSWLGLDDGEYGDLGGDADVPAREAMLVVGGPAPDEYEG